MYIYLSRNIKISVITLVTLIIFSLTYTTLDTFFMLSASVLHELGHIISAKMCKAKITSVTVGIGGADIKMNGITSYRDDAVISSGGIIFNLFFFALFPHHPFGIYNLIYAILNGLPICTLDGGRTLHSLLMMRFSEKCEVLCNIISCTALFVLWQFSVYLLFKTGANVSLFLFCVCIFSSLPDR